MITHIEKFSLVGYLMGKLADLNWKRRFLTQTPGDSQVGGQSRQVPGACWSRVRPTPAVEPKMRMWSEEVARDLDLDTREEEKAKLSAAMASFSYESTTSAKKKTGYGSNSSKSSVKSKGN